MSGENMQEIKSLIEGLKNDALAKVKEVEEKSNSSAEQMEARIKEVQESFDAKVKEIETSIAKRRIPGLAEELNKKQFSFHALIKAHYTQDWKDAEYEKEVLDTTKKSANASSGSAGGFLIPEEVSSDIVQLAIANTPILQMGVTQLNGLVGDLSIPKITGRPQGYWTGENGVPTEGNTAFGELKLNPKRLSAYSKVSDRLILQTRGVAEQIIREELANSMALSMEEGLIRGTGGENQPRGLSTFHSGMTASSVIGANGGRFTADKAAEMVKNIDVANHLKPTGSYGFLLRPEVKSGLKRERVAQFLGDTDGAPLFMPPLMSDAQLEGMIGYMLRTTTLLQSNLAKGTSATLSNVYFGNWANLLVGFWAGMSLKVSDVAGYGENSAFLQNQLWIVANVEMDSNVKDATAFTVVSDAETNEANW